MGHFGTGTDISGHHRPEIKFRENYRDLSICSVIMNHMYIWPVAYNGRSVNDTQEKFYLLKRFTQASDGANESEGRKITFITSHTML